MQTMKPKLILCLPLVLTGMLAGCSTPSSHAERWHGAASNGWQTKTIASEADLDRIIAQLQSPATRFDSFQALVEFAGWPGGSTTSDDLKVDDMHEKAVKAMRACPGLDAVVDTMIDRLKEPDNRLPMLRALLKFSEGFGRMPGGPSLPAPVMKARLAADTALDTSTTEKALVDFDWLLRFTAVEHFGSPPETINDWKRLLPLLEKLAVKDDSAIRKAADGKLLNFPETENFLAGRLINETSAEVILELVRVGTRGMELTNRFLPLFVPLLNHPDEKVREDALLFVGFNSNRAPMLQFPFGLDVFDRVLASTKAASAKERAAAAYALTDIRQLDPDRSREAFLNLVSDPDADVRWRIAWGLAGQYEREDVKQAIAVLLKDQSPEVRYMTITAAGPSKFILELEALAKGSDPRIAKWATEKLNQLANDKKH